MPLTINAARDVWAMTPSCAGQESAGNAETPSPGMVRRSLCHCGETCRYPNSRMGREPAGYDSTASCYHVSFNPRSRVGSDFGTLVPTPDTFNTVSIHAPAWGATLAQAGPLEASQGFNPRSLVGSDMDIIRRQSLWWEFQSTLPRGERRHRQGFAPAL
jgi:hypothetical protein